MCVWRKRHQKWMWMLWLGFWVMVLTNRTVSSMLSLLRFDFLSEIATISLVSPPVSPCLAAQTSHTICKTPSRCILCRIFFCVTVMCWQVCNYFTVRIIIHDKRWRPCRFCVSGAGVWRGVSCKDAPGIHRPLSSSPHIKWQLVISLSLSFALTQHAGPFFGDFLSGLVHVALFLAPHYTHSLPCTSDTTDNTDLPISHVCFVCSYLLCAINVVKREHNSAVSPSLVGTLNGFMARESPINHF